MQKYNVLFNMANIWFQFDFSSLLCFQLFVWHFLNYSSDDFLWKVFESKQKKRTK